jgi:HSP20 family protein
MIMAKTKETKGQIVPRTTRELSPFEEMDRMFDRLFEGGGLRPFDWRWPELMGLRRLEERMPRIDVIDRDDEVVVRAEIPGLRKEDLEVTLSHDLLTIKGETREEKEERGEFYRSEIRHGSFTRSVRLPEAVDGEAAKAHFEHGILEITIPKLEGATRRAIPVE